MTTITLNGTMPLGKLMQMFRQMADFDQTEMGAVVGASRATISAFERGERMPSFAQVVAWAHATGQPLEALVEAVERETAPSVDEAVSALRARRDSNPQPSDP